ncbi:hypothetical protein BRADI_5g06125v3 [Brachypodium distachyon]|uniref:Uncharacterized protein n=1 Tax=Brachypodium distachyon TaxID=15368 RepID=A0A2K2CFM0_BRADI|nr:hypothetical protein BRADI_5g06125v3 [Brachypodium distachyon]
MGTKCEEDAGTADLPEEGGSCPFRPALMRGGKWWLLLAWEEIGAQEERGDGGRQVGDEGDLEKSNRRAASAPPKFIAHIAVMDQNKRVGTKKARPRRRIKRGQSLRT